MKMYMYKQRHTDTCTHAHTHTLQPVHLKNKMDRLITQVSRMTHHQILRGRNRGPFHICPSNAESLKQNTFTLNCPNLETLELLGAQPKPL